MGKIYLSSGAGAACERLAADLAEANCDPFAGPILAVPNRNVKRWLQLRLARLGGVCANLRLIYLEEACWECLGAGARERGEVEPLEDGLLGQMILAVLLGEAEANPELAALAGYLGGEKSGAGDEAARLMRGWDLAERLSGLFRDYEFSRPEWRGECLRGSMAGAGRMEASERALYRRIFAEGGVRDSYAKAAGGAKPISLGELLEGVEGADADHGRRVYVFGVTQVSPLHVKLLERIGGDLRLYCISPIAGRLAGAADARAALVELLGGELPREDALSLWGFAAIECLRRLRPLFEDRIGAALLDVELLPERMELKGTALGALREVILSGREIAEPERVEQDTSLQVLNCPSIRREVQTVHDSILHHMGRDASLRLTDIAVLVPDMSAYRTAIMSAFAMPGRGVPYNLTDFRGRDASAYAQGVMALLDLPLGRFSRSDICSVLVNPCFMAGVGITREEADSWSDLAKELGVCGGFDADQWQASGYSGGSSNTWQRGFERLRMGRIFDRGLGAESGDRQAFGEIVPFADPVVDDESAGKFCALIERLNYRLWPMRTFRGSGSEWGQMLRAAIGEFLAVTDDRRGDRQVRDQVYAAIEELEKWDSVRMAVKNAPQMDLYFVRKHLGAALAGLSSTIGTYLTDGVTVSELQPLRPLPFRVCYVLGLGEGDFPGQLTTSSLDWRTESGQREVEGPDLNRLLFMETLLASGSQLYLSYVGRDLKKDQRLTPSSVVGQLVRMMGGIVRGGKFEEVEIPLLGSDLSYLPGGETPAGTDVFNNYSATDRLLCLLGPENRERFGEAIDEPAYKRAIVEAEQRVRENFSLTGDVANEIATLGDVSVGRLKDFLKSPIDAALKRHLRIDKEEEVEAADDEPFFSTYPADWDCLTSVMRRFVVEAVARSSTAALLDIEKWIDGHLDFARKIGSVPAGAAGAVDREGFLQKLRQMIGRTGDENSLARRIDDRRDGTWRFVPRLVIGNGWAAGAMPAGVVRAGALRVGDMPVSGAVDFVFVGNESVEVLTFGFSGSSAKGDVPSAVIGPFLSLAAAAAMGAECPVRVAGKPISICLANPEKLRRLEYPAWDAAVARNYLERLVADYLDTRRVELLPMECAIDVMKENADGAVSAEEFRNQLERVVEKSGGEFGVQLSEMVELLDAKVPGDAMDIVMRRLGPLMRVAAEKKKKEKKA